MRILTIETATPTESVGLVSDARIVAERTTRAGRGRADELVASVAHVLDKAALLLADLDGIAVSIGPGRFTGLRVGLATAKGLSASTGVPVLPVPTLEALAASVPREDLGDGAFVCSMLDARRGEVYAALFGPAPGAGRLSEDAALDPAAAARAAVDDARAAVREARRTPGSAARASEGEVVFVGTGASLYSGAVLEAAGPAGRLAAPPVELPGPVALASIAARLLSSGVPDRASVLPKYLRGL